MTSAEEKIDTVVDSGNSSVRPKSSGPSTPKVATPDRKVSVSTVKGKEAKNPDISDEGKAVVASGEWKEFHDAKKGKYYYLHVKEKKTVWDLDVELKKRAADPSADTEKPLAGRTTSILKGKKLPEDNSTFPASDGGRPPLKPVGPASLKPADRKPSDASLSPINDGGRARLKPVGPASLKPADKKPSAASLSPVKGNKSLKAPASKDPESSPVKSSDTASNPLGVATGDSIIAQHQENQGALQSLLEQNKKLQEMIAAGMNGPIALDFGGKLDALIRTNHSLTIQIKRLNTEHEAMVRALTDANVRIHEQKQELEACRGPIEVCSLNPSHDVAANSNEVTMTHLRESNRQLVQQVGELTALLARSLADQSYATAAMAGNDMGRSGSEGTRISGGSGGHQYGGYQKNISERLPLHNPNNAYLSESERPQYEQLDPNGQRHGPDAHYSVPPQSSRSPHYRSPYTNQSGAVDSYHKRSSSLSSTICSGPQYGHQQQSNTGGYYQSPSLMAMNGQLQYPPKSSAVAYGGFIVRSANSGGHRSMSCR